MRSVGIMHTRDRRRDIWTGNVVPVESIPTLSQVKQLNPNVITGVVNAARGTQLSQIMPMTPRIAHTLGVHDVYIEPITHGSGRAFIILEDPWTGPRPWQPPTTTKAPVIEFATDQIGRRLSIPFMNTSFLIGASKGGGKSVLEFVLAAGAACREDVILLGVDPKGTELQFFDKRFSAIVEDLAGTQQLCTELEREMAARYGALKRQRRKEFTEPAPQHPALLVIIDEGREVVDKDGPWGRASGLLLARFTLLAQKGRAAGISIIFATQHPDGSVIKTTFRSQLLNRWCGITEGPNQAQTIIGVEAANQVDTKALSPGTGYFQREGKRAMPLVQVDWLDTSGADRVDEATAHLRPEHAGFDAIRNAGTFNPAPAPPAPSHDEPEEEPAGPEEDPLADAQEAVAFVAVHADVDPGSIVDALSAQDAVLAAAGRVEGDPALVEELWKMAERLRELFRP